MSSAHDASLGAGGHSPPAPSGDEHHALRLEHTTKHFGGTQAIDDVSLRVRPGTVHALLGGNGSGKSTLIKILAAVHTADSGELEVGGAAYDLAHHSSHAAHEAGLRFVHQDLGLFADLSVEENFALAIGYPRMGASRVDWKRLRRHVSGVLEEYEIDASAHQSIGDLRPSTRTMVAIARALSDAGEEGDTGQSNSAERLVLVLDEPTASLAAHESDLLLSQVRRRAELGQTVLLVSHRLREVLAVAHDFTILRDGRVAGTLVDAEPSEDELIEIMAGGLVPALRPTGSITHATTRPVLQLENLVSGPVRGVDLTVHEGEIVGLAGLVGSGRSSLLQAVFGAVQHHDGTMRIDAEEHTPGGIWQAIDAGVAMVPENRVGDAAFPDLTVRDNLSISMLKEYWRQRWMPRGRETRAANSLIERFGIKVAEASALFSSMSGGNQQKTIIARWLQREPKLLLLDEPTQGVDVMSRSDIYGVIRAAARDGCAVLVASSDVSELHALADRVVVLSNGVLTDEVESGEMDVEGLTGLVLRDAGGRLDDSESAKRVADPPPVIVNRTTLESST